jgi:ribosomal protein S24E
MELKKDIKNLLMKRHEVSYLVEAPKTPGFVEMKKKVSEESKKPEENIDVYGVQGKFERNTFLIKAYIYDSAKDLEAIKKISRTQKQRIAEKEEIKKAEEEKKKAAEEAKKPKEAPVEEAKAE